MSTWRAKVLLMALVSFCRKLTIPPTDTLALLDTPGHNMSMDTLLLKYCYLKVVTKNSSESISGETWIWLLFGHALAALFSCPEPWIIHSSGPLLCEKQRFQLFKSPHFFCSKTLSRSKKSPSNKRRVFAHNTAGAKTTRGSCRDRQREFMWESETVL